MGNKNTRSSLRNAIIYLNISADEISADDDKFWNQIFSEDMAVADDVIKNITVQEIRMLRDGSPKNFATLAYKMVERLCLATGTLCNTHSQQTAVLNAIRILIIMLPCVFEDPLWRYFFEENTISLASDPSGKQPDLKYPKKSQHERNYNAYLPQRLGSSSATPSSYTNTDTNHSEGATRSACAGGGRSSRQSGSQFGGQNATDEELLISEKLLSSTGSSEQQRRAGCCTGSASREHGREHEPQHSSAFDMRPSSGDRSLMKALTLSICDLLFCPEFTVLPHGDSYLANAVDGPPEDLKSISTYDYVWEPGVGFDSNVNSTTYYDKNRSELLRALLVCLSVTLYESPEESINLRNDWMEVLVSQENRHALPLFTSLLNVVFSYRPSRPLLQFSNFLSDASRERLVELSCQLLIATLDYNNDHHEHNNSNNNSNNTEGHPILERMVSSTSLNSKVAENRNLFIEYMSRIHREEDFVFLVKGFIRLMNNGLEQGYIWAPSRSLELDQELQVLLWRICNLNKKFVQHLLKSSEVLDIVVPILYHLNENFQEPSRTALIHIGVFNLLILSGERNFGVRLNKPYTSNLLGNLPELSGSHADLMILVFHKLIMYGYKISQLYDYLLTVLVNVSPYLKGMPILACKCLIQLFETFSHVLVIFTEPNYHQLVIFLLEIFNNLIQYQFDGNANLVYMILNKKQLFIELANLPTTQSFIDKALKRLLKRKQRMEQLELEEANANTVQQSPGPDMANAQQMTTTTTTSSSSSSSSCCNWANNDSKSRVSDDLDPDSLATVSCTTNHNQSSSSANTNKQEVSLVATPDLRHATHPIHPFDYDGRDMANANHQACMELGGDSGRGKCATGTNAQETQPSISLDDLLNVETDDCPLTAVATSTTATNSQVSTTNDPHYQQQSSDFEFDLISEGEPVKTSAQQVVGDGPNGKLPGQNVRKPPPNESGCSSARAADRSTANSAKWRPTPSWLREWKQTLPLQTVLRMICALEPQIELLKRTGGGGGRAGVDEAEIIKFLQNGTIVGLLPVPHPIQIRKYRTNNRSTMWFRACSWGIIYVRSTIWTGTDIKLIKIL